MDAGTYGFDPLELGKDPASLLRFRESELIHGRWAMLGVAGALAVEVLGYGNWADAPLWVRERHRVSGPGLRGVPTAWGAGCNNLARLLRMCCAGAQRRQGDVVRH